MKTNLQQRLILAFAVIITVSLIGSFLIINGIGMELFYDLVEEPKIDKKIPPVREQHDTIKSILISKAKNQNANFSDLDKYSSEENGERMGHLILMDNKEIYRSPSLATLQIQALTSNEFLDYYEEANSLIIDQVAQTNIIFPSHTYDLYSYYIFPIRENPYAFIYGLYNFSIFTVIITVSIFLLTGIFRHMRKNTRALNHMTDQIIHGDLETEMALNNEGDFTILANSIDKMRQNLFISAKEKEYLEEERERMFMNIAHDIKTPITSIKGYSQILANDYILDTQTKKEYLDIIVDKSHVIEKMIYNLGEVIQYKGSTLKLEKMCISAKAFLEDCINEFLIESQDRDFDIKLFIAPDVDKFYADPSLLQRVFINIIGNSLKYNPNNFTHIEMKCTLENGRVCFCISDDGIGVPEESLSKLFDRLYRVDASRNSNIEGSGIGLSICKEIIEAHKGSICAHNKDNKFIIQFDLINEEC
jgi:signal transduction histidine kinase